MRPKGKIGRLAWAALVAAAFAVPARTATVGVGTVPALCTHDLSDGPRADGATNCKPLTGKVLVASGPIARHGAKGMPERRALSDLSPREALLAARGLLMNFFADGVAQSNRSDVHLLRVDLGRLRSGLSGFGPIPIGLPVMNIGAPIAGIDASDFVFPGEAAARILFWNRKGPVAEWTVAWGSILIPFTSSEPDEPVAQRPIPIAPLFIPVRSPLNLKTIPSSKRLPQSSTLVRTPVLGSGLPAVPAPIPLPPAWAGLGGAIVLLAGLKRRRRTRKAV